MSSRRESDFVRLEQRLKEAEERAEVDRQRAGKLNQRAEEEQQRVDKLNQRAEEEQQRVDKLNQRAEEEQQRADKLNQRAEPLTFEGLLKACHEHLHKAIAVETEKCWTTKGFTNPRNKFYPNNLRPWQDFPEFQAKLFDEVFAYMHRADGTGGQCG